MEVVCKMRKVFVNNRKLECREHYSKEKSLANAKINNEYTIEHVRTDNAEIKDFLFTLGCYEGEKVTVISILADNYVISVKDARYSIDKDLAESIIVL